VTKEGNPVLGQKGLIVLGDGDFSVAADGTVSQNGEVVDKLLIAEFADTTVLKKYGNNLLQADEDAQVTEFTGEVMQGYLEQSNVNIVKEMVDMITVQRTYEANQKVLKAMDGTLEKAVNEVGAVR
jgi:flagellar basal-body rod protein FlgG